MTEDYKIQLPVRVYCALSSERTEEDIQILLIRANSIWSEAGIEFRRAGKATRLSYEPILEFDSFGRPGDLDRLAEDDDGGQIAIYALPNRNMGYGRNGRNPSATQRVLLADVTSLDIPGTPAIERNDSRVLAHEVGHILGLAHLEKTTANKDLLMVQGWNGTKLTEAEIGTARAKARALAVQDGRFTSSHDV